MLLRQLESLHVNCLQNLQICSLIMKSGIVGFSDIGNTNITIKLVSCTLGGLCDDFVRIQICPRTLKLDLWGVSGVRNTNIAIKIVRCLRVDFSKNVRGRNWHFLKNWLLDPLKHAEVISHGHVPDVWKPPTCPISTFGNTFVLFWKINV